MAIYFDIGANDGCSMEHFAHQGHKLISFEPNPEMYNIVKAKTELYPNWLVHRCAISDYNGTAEFNVCVTHDRGCSSLLEVSDAGKTQWGGRQDMIPDHRIKVDVWRLDRFFYNWDEIPEIEFFHCDTQGSDLRVLQGMGPYLRRIKAGVVEAATKPDILYKGQNSLVDTKSFLQQNGFVISNVVPNDVQNNEVNVFFTRLDSEITKT
jgi:FkbM family methyltransferase